MNWSGVLGTPVKTRDSGTPKVMDLPAFDGYGDPKKLDVISRIAEQGGRDPQLATIAVNIFRECNVAPRDYRGQAAAILKWVQRNIYYVNEPDERLQDPFYTLKVKYGDCFPASTLLLTEGHELRPIRDVRPGMKVWGRDRWSLVEAVEDKGTLAVTHIRLTNGSTLRLTEGHKVYVEKCGVHGVGCPLKNPCCTSVGQERIRVSELRDGMVLITPESIPFGTEDLPVDTAYVEGLYLADGSIHHKYTRKDGTTAAYDFSVAGRDGKPKEAQKHEIAAICDRLGLTYRIDKKEITVHGAEWATRLLAMGAHAPDKHAATINLTESAATSLLRGIMADSGRNTSGGHTFTSTSYLLALQTRLLWKMVGRTCGYRYVENHGGLGRHPVHRINPRLTPEDGAQRSEKRLRVKSISREVESVPCFDIQTDDHYVYVPDADVTVSNCDDMAILVYALARSVRLPARLVISGVTKNGTKVRYRQGDPSFDRSVDWSHIYLMIGDRPYGQPEWMYAEPTLNVPLGWDVVAHKGDILPEMTTTSSYGSPMPAFDPTLPRRITLTAPAIPTFSPSVPSSTYAPSYPTIPTGSPTTPTNTYDPSIPSFSPSIPSFSPSPSTSGGGYFANTFAPTVPGTSGSGGGYFANTFAPTVPGTSGSGSGDSTRVPLLYTREGGSSSSLEERVIPEGQSAEAPTYQQGGDVAGRANSVAILLVDRGGQILLLHRAPDQALMGGAWDLPGGKVDPRGPARDQAVRILLAEAGIKLPASALRPLLTAYHPSAGTAMFFVAQVPGDAARTARVSAPEHVEFRWVTPGEGREDMQLVPYMPLVLRALHQAMRGGSGYGAPDFARNAKFGVGALIAAVAAGYVIGQLRSAR